MICLLVLRGLHLKYFHQVIHADSPTQSDFDDDFDDEDKSIESAKKAKKKTVSISSKRRSSAGTSVSVHEINQHLLGNLQSLSVLKVTCSNLFSHW